MLTAWVVCGQRHTDIKTAMLKNIMYFQLLYRNEAFTKINFFDMGVCGSAG